LTVRRCVAYGPMIVMSSFERGMLKAALERAGVEFTNGKHAGVRVR